METEPKVILDRGDFATLLGAFEAVADLLKFRTDDPALDDLLLDLDELMGRVSTILGD